MRTHYDVKLSKTTKKPDLLHKLAYWIRWGKLHVQGLYIDICMVSKMLLKQICQSKTSYQQTLRNIEPT